MTAFNIYEAYAAVYNEELREEILTVEENFEFIDELSDNELDQVMEEILSEGVELSECFEVLDEFLSEARVDMAARAAARKKYAQASEKSAGEARKRGAAKERSERRAERVERIKSSVKRAAEKVKTTAAGVASAAAGGAAEAGRAAKGAASAAKKKVTGKLAAAKERIKSAVKSGRTAVAGGLRKAAAKIEPKGTEEKGKEVKSAAKTAISRRSAAMATQASAAAGTRGTSVTQGQPAGTFATKKSRNQAQRREARLTASENFELIATAILEDLISEGYAETFEEAFTVLESMTDYAVGDIAESYLVEEVETIDLYDVVLEHLLDEGFADTEDAASVIMANMSEEWRNEILEDYKDFPTAKVMNKAAKLMGSSAGKTDSKSKKKEERGIKMMDVTMQHTPDR